MAAKGARPGAAWRKIFIPYSRLWIASSSSSSSGTTGTGAHTGSTTAATSFPTLLLIAFLCTASYLLGNSLPSPPRASSRTTVSCVTAPRRTITRSITLDFSAHHSGADHFRDSRTGSTPSNASFFPICPANFSEYTPCEDPARSRRFPGERLAYLERHCPDETERQLTRCLVPAPPGYRAPFPWPESRGAAWFANVPHRELVKVKANQNWVRVDGDVLRFPGGGTMFPQGADAYIDEIAALVPMKDGSVRTAIDTGCGVASWGAYLMSRGVLTMSLAPRDGHEAQVQFGLERGVPAMIAVLATKRLPFPARAFDMAHCSRCLIPWHLHGGQYLIEVDRLLRPGGYWVLSGPPINWQHHWQGWHRPKGDLRAEQAALEAVAEGLCWTKLHQRGDIAVWQKPLNRSVCNQRPATRPPPFCSEERNPDAAWYTELESCITPLPPEETTRGTRLKRWPRRLTSVPPRIRAGTIPGVTPRSFQQDTALWAKRLRHYKAAAAGAFSLQGPPRPPRNVLDMNANLGGFAASMAAAAAGDAVWVMNVVPVSGPDTLGAVYERGLIGVYHDWCEAMSTYPRTYDLVHCDGLRRLYEGRCGMEDVLLEVDRVLRPGGVAVFRDDVDVLVEVKRVAEGMRWDAAMADHEDGPFQPEKILVATKRFWAADGDAKNPQQQGSKGID